MTGLPEGLHGAHRRSELIVRLGLETVRRLQRDGLLVRYSRNVLVDRTRMLDLQTRAAAALLYVGPKSALTGHTAARLFGCTAADVGTVHLISGYDRKARLRPGMSLHQGFFEEDDILELDGLRTLCLEVVIAEMLCTVHRPFALAVADQAMGALDPPFREAFREEVARRLRARVDLRGIRRAEVLLGLTSGLPESPAESQMLLVLYDAGLPIPVLQRSIVDLSGRERYRLDFAWEEPKVALEYDGFEAHEHRLDQDAARDVDLRLRGWVVLRATSADLRDPRRLLSALRGAFGQRRHVA
jgi:hypothetical protein